MSAPGQDTKRLTLGTVRHKSENLAKHVSVLWGVISTNMDMWCRVDRGNISKYVDMS
jgi:hypothetical protein